MSPQGHLEIQLKPFAALKHDASDVGAALRGRPLLEIQLKPLAALKTFLEAGSFQEGSSHFPFPDLTSLSISAIIPLMDRTLVLHGLHRPFSPFL